MSSVTGSRVPKLDFDDALSICRKLYTTLAIKLMLDPMLALQIVALWIWMDRMGFIDSVEKIYKLPVELIEGLAEEAIVCIDYFKQAVFPTPSELSNSVPLLHFLMKKEIPHLFLPDYRAIAVDGMKKVFNEIYRKDMVDLYEKALQVQAAVNHKVADKQISQLAWSFNSSVSLGDTAVYGNSSSGNSSRIGFGLGPSSLLPSHSLRSGLLRTAPHNDVSLGSDPVKLVLPGSPVSSPHGYVGMGRSSSSSRDLGGSSFSSRELGGSSSPNRALDLAIPVHAPIPVRPKPNVGVIGEGRLARSESFNREMVIPRMTLGPNLLSPGHLHPNPRMAVSPPTLSHPLYHRKHLAIPGTFVPPEQRTLFVTFSKGYRVTEPELRDFITLCYGNCIESLIMQETHSEAEQPLYARIVFFSPKTADLVLNGNEKAKFTIHGKHVWARKFIPKNQRTNTNSDP